MFERWRAHYRARHQAKEAAADARARELWDERGRVAARRALLPAGPLREAAERRLFAIGHEIADLYRPRRPEVLAASWAADNPDA